MAILNFVDWRFSEISLLLRPFAWGVSGGSVAAQAIMLFILGAFVYRIKQHAHISHPKIFNTVVFSFLILVGAAIAGNWTHGRKESFLFWESNALIANLLACLVLILGLLLWNYTESPKSLIIGKLTYPVYLIHWPVIQLFLPSTAFASYLREFSKNFYLADYLLLAMTTSLISIFIGIIWLKIETRFFAARHQLTKIF